MSTMTKAQLIEKIAKLQGRDANRPYLKTLPIEKLETIYERWRAVMATTDAECRRNCDVSFIK